MSDRDLLGRLERTRDTRAGDGLDLPRAVTARARGGVVRVSVAATAVPAPQVSGDLR